MQKKPRQISLYRPYLTRATFFLQVEILPFMPLTARALRSLCVCFLAGAWPDHLVTTLQINKNIKVGRDSLGTFRISNIFCELFSRAHVPSRCAHLDGAAHPPSKEITHAVRLKFYDPGSTVFFYMHCFMRLGVHVSPRRKLTYPFSIPWKAQVTGRGYLGCSETGCVLFFVVLQRLATT